MRGRNFAILFFGLAAFYLIVKTTTGLVQTPVFIVTCATAFYFVAGVRRVRTLLIAIGMSGVLIAILFLGVAQARYWWMTERGASAGELLEAVILSKVITRQGRSANCLDNIATKHRAEAGTERPFYFLSAIVPRALWPEKPVLSLGYEYGVKYCGSKSPRSDPHYELITLLAEPLLHGGWSGLIAAQIFLGLGLGLVGFYMPRAGVIPLIAIVALLPWLIHFQQSLALYFANSVKMFLYMLPALAMIRWWTRREHGRNGDAVA